MIGGHSGFVCIDTTRPVVVGVIALIWEPDPLPLPREFDAELRAAVESGEIPVEGCYAFVEVVINGVIQHLRSGGLYGITGADPVYRRVVEADERAQLRSILARLGLRPGRRRRTV